MTIKKEKVKSCKVKNRTKPFPDFCRMYFGAPRSGKTTFAVKEAQLFLKAGYPVYTNFPCTGCFQIDPLQIGKYQLPDSIVICDEAGIDFSNRDYKTLAKSFIEYIKLHGHYHTSFIFLSQGWDDCDKKIRTVCTEYWVVRKLGKLSFRRELRKRVDLSDDHQIIDAYFKVKARHHGLKFCWRPKWYKYFNSWERPTLPDYPRELWTASPSKNDLSEKR